MSFISRVEVQADKPFSFDSQTFDHAPARAGSLFVKKLSSKSFHLERDLFNYQEILQLSEDEFYYRLTQCALKRELDMQSIRESEQHNRAIIAEFKERIFKRKTGINPLALTNIMSTISIKRDDTRRICMSLPKSYYLHIVKACMKMCNWQPILEDDELEAFNVESLFLLASQNKNSFKDIWNIRYLNYDILCSELDIVTANINYYLNPDFTDKISYTEDQIRDDAKNERLRYKELIDTLRSIFFELADIVLATNNPAITQPFIDTMMNHPDFVVDDLPLNIKERYEDVFTSIRTYFELRGTSINDKNKVRYHKSWKVVRSQKFNPMTGELCDFFSDQYSLKSMLTSGLHLRFCDERFNRRYIRKEIDHADSHCASLIGIVGKFQQEFVSDFTCERYRQRQENGRVMLSSHGIAHADEDGDSVKDQDGIPCIITKKGAGEIVTVLELKEKKEQLANAATLMLLEGIGGMATEYALTAIATTSTLPGEFHANPANQQTRKSVYNPELGPRDQARFECKRANKFRAYLRKYGCLPMGISVSEPHQDGTLHKHNVHYIKTEHVAVYIRAIERFYNNENAHACRYQILQTEGERCSTTAYALVYVMKNVKGSTYYEDKDKIENSKSDEELLTSCHKERYAAWRSISAKGRTISFCGLTKGAKGIFERLIQIHQMKLANERAVSENAKENSEEWCVQDRTKPSLPYPNIPTDTITDELIDHIDNAMHIHRNNKKHNANRKQHEPWACKKTEQYELAQLLIKGGFTQYFPFVEFENEDTIHKRIYKHMKEDRKNDYDEDTKAYVGIMRTSRIISIEHSTDKKGNEQIKHVHTGDIIAKEMKLKERKALVNIKKWKELAHFKKQRKYAQLEDNFVYEEKIVNGVLTIVGIPRAVASNNKDIDSFFGVVNDLAQDCHNKIGGRHDFELPTNIFDDDEEI